MNMLRHIALLLLMPCWTGSAQGQTTWYVDDDCALPGSGTEVDPFCTIQDGVDAAKDGDTVLMGSGTYTGEGNRDISLFGKSITLISTDGPSLTVIDIEGTPTSIHRGFFLIHGETHETVIEGLTIINGYLIGDTGGTGPGGGGGGGAFYIRDSSPTIHNCIIRDHISATLSPPFPVDGRGAGIYVDGNSSAVIENCVIADNVADRRGGGMYVGYEDSTVAIRNCLVVGNTNGPNYPGGGVYLTFGTTTISNTTIVKNISGGAGGGMLAEGSEPLLTNCILWENQAGPKYPGQQIAINGAATVTISYSAVQNGMDGVANFGQLNWGPGMIDADPWFVDPTNGGFRLLYGSPCIDAGNNLAVPEDVTTDLDGGPRFLDDPDTPDTGNPDPDDPKLPIVDMGPYEYDADDCNNNDILDAEDIADGTSQDCNFNQIPDECESNCNGNGVPDECCPADLNGDEIVNAFDLAQLLGSWAPCPDSCIEDVPTCACPADFDRNCTVGASDLAVLLGHWGPCQ